MARNVVDTGLGIPSGNGWKSRRIAVQEHIEHKEGEECLWWKIAEDKYITLLDLEELIEEVKNEMKGICNYVKYSHEICHKNTLLLGDLRSGKARIVRLNARKSKGTRCRVRVMGLEKGTNNCKWNIKDAYVQVIQDIECPMRKL